jgi:BNR/asp-box repeat protein
MNKTLLLSLAFGLSAAGAFAADVFTPPFETTTIEGGQFAAGTRWYTLQISTNGFHISNPGNDGAIQLVRTTTELDDKDLWCFVGTPETGYRIYNKATGVSKVLTAPKTMEGTAGGGSLVTLRDVADAATYDADWKFEKSTDLGADKPAVYMYPSEQPSHKVNNRDARFSFWTGGKDHGSSLQVLFAMQRVQVSVDKGTMTTQGSSTYKNAWTSTQTAPQVRLTAVANNMLAKDNNLWAYVGNKVLPSDYTLTAGAGYSIRGFEFDAKSAEAGKHLTVAAGNKSFTTTETAQHMSWTGDNDTPAAKFTLSGSNNAALLTDFYVTVTRQIAKPEPQQNVFVYNNSTPVTYRIPAITTAKNGTVLAVTDSRHTGMGDIGAGRIDLFLSRSTDNGATWSNPDVLRDASGNAVAQGIGKDNNVNANDRRNAGYGDAAIVADRESNDVILLSASGQVGFFGSTRNTPIAVARWYSHDNGTTWTQPDDITDHIYSLFDGADKSPRGKVESLFFGSGRIVQSHRVKVGTHYRLYAVVVGRNTSPNVHANWVLYSDDFGKNWNVLGKGTIPAVPENADEPKAEELPDGSVLVSSRVGGGRYFNIYRFTDVKTGEGKWGNVAYSRLKKASSNACNGEVMVVPVQKRATGEKLYLALQSVPFGPSGRTNVGINYKPLAAATDFDTPANFSNNWEGAHEASRIGSAYSTMTWQNDNTLGFLYEEETFRTAGQGGYTIVYKNYSIEQITDSVYTYAADNSWTVADDLRTKMVAHRVAAITAGKYVGQYTAAAAAAANAAAATYNAAPSAEAYEQFNAQMEQLPTVEVDSKKLYRLRNEGYLGTQGALYLKANVGGTAYEGAALEETDDAFFFALLPAGNPGEYVLYNEKTKTYLPKFGADNVTPALVSDVANAGVFTLITRPDGRTSLSGVNFSGRKAVHLAREKKLVPWNIDSGASYWMLEETDKLTAVKKAEGRTQAEVRQFDLQGRRANENTRGIVVGADGKKSLR